ncbi:MFS transporter [Phycicoccus endophyticus]|uniref:MFS transporter n=1 Tax=Phycicoccus endophyticus TaxID=1690220 RepID=A0A7G9R639_9MICO|nr:MFS transporter [Phycicoccus endophyticus]QNN51064.1 MFS transporter [Phycicoccus endophyticus]
MTTPDARVRIPREIWVLIAAAFVIALGFGLITPVLPTFAQSFGVGATASSVVVSAFAAFRLLFAPAGGRLIARLGERPVYLAGLVIVAVSTGATAFAGSYWQLLLFRGLGGVGSVMFTVSAVALIVRLAPPSIRARVSSAYASAFLIGGVGGPVVGGLLGGLGLRVPFLVYAVALLLAASIVFVFLKDASLRPREGAPVLPAMTVRDGWRDSAYRAAVGSAFANGWGNFGVRNAILPLFAAAVIVDRSLDAATRETHQSLVAGAALAVFAVGNAVGLTIAGRTSDRLGRKPFVLAGLLVSGVFTAATGLASDLPTLLAFSAAAGLGAGSLNPAQQASLADVVGRERNGGPALAAVQMAQDTGAIVGPVIAGTMVDHGSFGLAFGVTGGITLLAVLPWLRARETHEVVRAR